MPPEPIRLIAGLGNPGREYAGTRHNAGFMALDRLARRFHAEWKADRAHKAEVASARGVLLVKPQTYMNLSGECVGALMRYFKCSPAQVLVIYDDIAFPVGALRLRAAGSAGGHNGMKSVIAHLGTDRFPRLRVGIGSPGQKEMTGHVLGRFAPDEQPLLEECLARVEAAALAILSDGFDKAATLFNAPRDKMPQGKKPRPPEGAPGGNRPSPPAGTEG